MSRLRIRNLTREIVVATAEVADSAKARRTGLLGRTGLAPGEGLWIAPCEAVHTFGMQFPIDVLFLSRSKKVLKIRREMGRRRIAACLRAHSVLELPAGAAAQTGTEPGDQLEFEKLA